MLTDLQTKEIYPFIIRRITMDDKTGEIEVEYSIYGDNDLSFSYKKIFKSPELAWQSMADFIKWTKEQEHIENIYSTNENYQEAQQCAYKRLYQLIIDGKVDILQYDPGFLPINLDIEYIKEILISLQ